MLTPREATEAPTQRSRSPLSPTEVTELATVRLFLILSALLCSLRPGFCIVCDLATVRLFLILSALLCSLRPGFCIVCDFAHARPIMLQHSTSIWGERERAPSCGLNGRAVTIYIYIYRYIDVRTFTATAHARRYAQT